MSVPSPKTLLCFSVEFYLLSGQPSSFLNASNNDRQLHSVDVFLNLAASALTHPVMVWAMPFACCAVTIGTSALHITGFDKPIQRFDLGGLGLKFFFVCHLLSPSSPFLISFFCFHITLPLY